MTTEAKFELIYQEDEVVAAQRMRFIDSSRFKLGIALAIIGTVVLTAQQMCLWYAKGVIPASWFTPALWPALFIGVGWFAYLFAPSIDFRLNPDWKRPLDVHVSEEKLQLIAPGQRQGFELHWARVNKVLENRKLYILFFGSEREFVILPKRIFKDQESYFRETLKRKASPTWKVGM